MNWLYRFITNGEYPDPVEEIDALCMIDESDETTYLLLSDRKAPPLSGSSCGDVVGLCTSEDGRLVLHGTAVVAGACRWGDTPASVRPIYGELTSRWFCPLKDAKRLPSLDLQESILSYPDQARFLKGQSFVKRLSQDALSVRPALAVLARVTTPSGMPTCPVMVYPHMPQAFTVVGIDPTAGTWESRMEVGVKEMPSFALRWNGHRFEVDGQPLAWHLGNGSFRDEVNGRDAVVTCIDGPCGTNGPRLNADVSGWETGGSNETRGGELALSRQGVSLFWTTENTVLKFDGASRWIARSLVLFSEDPVRRKLETHPHGAFTFLWRLFGGSGPIPKKSGTVGKQARLSILRAFIDGLADGMVPNHDALDAACSALVAGLHRLGLTMPFGSPSDGGQLWMPDGSKIAPLLHCPK